MDRETIAQQESPTQERDRIMRDLIILRREVLTLEAAKREAIQSTNETIDRRIEIEREIELKKTAILDFFTAFESTLKASAIRSVLKNGASKS